MFWKIQICGIWITNNSQFRDILPTVSTYTDYFHARPEGTNKSMSRWEEGSGDAHLGVIGIG
jgi:hypothetical protein